jgi:hypothetical protein
MMLAKTHNVRLRSYGDFRHKHFFRQLKENLLGKQPFLSQIQKSVKFCISWCYLNALFF